MPKIPTPFVDTAEVLAAVRGMAEVLGDSMTAHDAGGHFTCTEAQSVADVLEAAGHTDAATTWLEGHASGDEDEYDRHHDLYLSQRSA